MSKCNKYKNALRDKYVNTYPEKVVVNTDLASFVKFNFKFLDPSQSDKGFYDIDGLSDKDRKFVLCKLREFSGKCKTEWTRTHVGGGKSHVLKILQGYPRDTPAERPSYVPADVDWAEFRLDGAFRLVGFFVPKALDGKEISIQCVNYHLDSNTFYIVFIDPNHQFCPYEKKGS